MKDIILLICFIIMTIFGYFLIGKWGKFLMDNRRAIAEQKRKKKLIWELRRLWGIM